MVPVDGPVRHVTLSRVLVLALVPSVVALALSIYNTNRVNQDRAQRRAQIDAEICAVVARIPGPGIPDFERVIGCPMTEPIPLPTVTSTPTSAPGPVSARSSLLRPSHAATSSPAPMIVGATASPTPVVITPRRTPAPSPSVSPLIDGLLHQLLP